MATGSAEGTQFFSRQSYFKMNNRVDSKGITLRTTVVHKTADNRVFPLA
jgi:hypothetical protein